MRNVTSQNMLESFYSPLQILTFDLVRNDSGSFETKQNKSTHSALVLIQVIMLDISNYILLNLWPFLKS